MRAIAGWGRRTAWALVAAMSLGASAPMLAQGEATLASSVRIPQGVTANGEVRGKELATVVAPPDVKAVAKRTPPAEGNELVQVLRGNEYLRIWVNEGGTQYLVHLVRASN